jgi:hypothetical protein
VHTFDVCATPNSFGQFYLFFAPYFRIIFLDAGAVCLFVPASCLFVLRSRAFEFSSVVWFRLCVFGLVPQPSFGSLFFFFFFLLAAALFALPYFSRTRINLKRT